LRKYKGYAGNIAFISPCIAKKIEFSDSNNSNYINYNITIHKLKDYIITNKIDISTYPEVEFDNPAPNIGFNYSRPGGLKEQVDYYNEGDF